MATRDFTFHLYLVSPHSTPDNPYFTLVSSDDMESHGWVHIRKEVFTLEVPTAKELLQPQLAALEKLKQETRAKFAMAIKEIDDRINSLLAIENSAPGDSF